MAERGRLREDGRWSLVTLVLILWLVTGCSSIGPSTLNRDRFDYMTAISESWKKQALLNIVKLRYADTPVFLEVGQVISGYEVEGTFSAGGTIGNKTAPGALGDFVNLGGSGRYLDRPTVTYNPLTGSDFIKTMVTPFPPGALMLWTPSCRTDCTGHPASTRSIMTPGGKGVTMVLMKSAPVSGL